MHLFYNQLLVKRLVLPVSFGKVAGLHSAFGHAGREALSIRSSHAVREALSIRSCHAVREALSIRSCHAVRAVSVGKEVDELECPAIDETAVGEPQLRQAGESHQRHRHVRRVDHAAHILPGGIEL